MTHSVILMSAVSRLAIAILISAAVWGAIYWAIS